MSCLDHIFIFEGWWDFKGRHLNGFSIGMCMIIVRWFFVTSLNFGGPKLFRFTGWTTLALQTQWPKVGLPSITHSGWCSF